MFGGLDKKVMQALVALGLFTGGSIFAKSMPIENPDSDQKKDKKEHNIGSEQQKKYQEHERKYLGKTTLDGATVQGNVSTDLENVKNALVTYINEADTTKKYSGLTEGFGNYIIFEVPLANEDQNIILPDKLNLKQNYPNPFNPSTIIPYEVGERGHVNLKVYDILGREVKTLVDRVVERGEHAVEWKGDNNQGNYVSSGVYLYVLTDGEKRETKKMLFLGGGEGVTPGGIFYVFVPDQNPPVNHISISNNAPEFPKLEKILTGSTYTLKITNTPETQPRITEYFQYNIPIDGDTTINVVVEKELVNISGNLYDLFQDENIPITGAIVTFGSVSDTTDSEGNYGLFVNPNTKSRLVFNHSRYYERKTSEFEALIDTLINETMVDTSFNMEHYDKVCRFAQQNQHPGTQRWTTVPTVYVNINPAPNQAGDSTKVTQAMIDTALSVISDLPQFAYKFFLVDTVNIEIGTNPPPYRTEGYIIFMWDNTVGPAHGEYLEGNRIYSTYARVGTGVGRSTYLEELTQTLGARADSNIFQPSIFNYGGAGQYYFSVDLLIGKFLYSRKPGNISPDTGP